MKNKNDFGKYGLFSKAELLRRLEKVRIIISSSVWDDQVNKAYFELFDVNMEHLTGKPTSPSAVGTGTGYGNTVSFEWSIACVDPLVRFVETISGKTQRTKAQEL